MDDSISSYPYKNEDVVACLGRGHFSEVLCVRCRPLDIISTTGFVAVKRFSSYDDAARSDRIMHERHVLGVLSEKDLTTGSPRCPYIVNLISTHKSENLHKAGEHYLYLIQSAALGGSLHKHILRYPGGSGIHPTITRGITAELVAALTHMYKHRCIHRDIKASNILFDHYGHVSLCDFGSSKQLPPPPAQEYTMDVLGNMIPIKKDTAAKQRHITFTLTGTLHCMSPEMAAEFGHSFEVDWWALGVLLHEMLSGAPPAWEYRPELSNTDVSIIRDSNMAHYARLALIDDGYDLPESPAASKQGDSKYDESGGACFHWNQTSSFKATCYQNSALAISSADLISHLLAIHPSKRATLETVEKHDFFDGVNWKDIHAGISRSPWGNDMDKRLGFLELIETSNLGNIGSDDVLTDEQQALFNGF